MKVREKNLKKRRKKNYNSYGHLTSCYVYCCCRIVLCTTYRLWSSIKICTKFPQVKVSSSNVVFMIFYIHMHIQMDANNNLFPSLRCRLAWQTLLFRKAIFF